MSPGRPLEDRVALVTGGGRGLGRSHALHLASLGAVVVVNDLGVSTGGESLGEPAARMVVDEITAAGGRATASTADCADFAAAEELVADAVAEFGRLDILVNNAGILRDRMVFNMDDDDWDDVVRVHLRGHAAPLRAAARHWRGQRKSVGHSAGRVINTSSESGLYGNAGQTNYSAVKAGILALTQAAARELLAYGVTVNAIAPRARTRMVEQTWGTEGDETSGAFGSYPPGQVSQFVGWLADDRAAAVTGQAFTVFGDTVQLMQGWTPVTTIRSTGGGFDLDELVRRSEELFAGREPTIGPFPFDPQTVAGS
jgi:3-oxoacyl-[acyl-carrier protein] reductase